MSNSLVISPRLVYPAIFFVILVVGLAFVGKVPLTYNIRNLAVRWRITLLTALAFTLVVALMTIMLAFVNGMYRLTQGSGVPGNIIVMSDGATDEMFSNLSRKDVSRIGRWEGVLEDHDGRPMISWETYIVVNQPIPGAEKGARKRRFLQVRGVDEPERSARTHNLKLYPGGDWFSDSGVEDTATTGSVLKPIQAVIGEGIARELGKDLGKPTLQVGELFAVGPRQWIVKGIMQSAGSTFDSEIWAKRGLVGPMFGKDVYTSIVLRTTDADTARTVARDLTSNFKDAAVLAQAESDYYEKLNTTNQQFLYAIGFVAVIMAIGGVFGVMNTMFAAISQRIKDIGVLRILGFARWQILVSFFLETLFLALLGGLIGCALGSLANGYTASSIISGGAGGGKSVVLKLVVDANILVTGLLFSLAMGCAGGLLPALSAMRLKPLDAVR